MLGRLAGFVRVRAAAARLDIDGHRHEGDGRRAAREAGAAEYIVKEDLFEILDVLRTVASPN